MNVEDVAVDADGAVDEINILNLLLKKIIFLGYYYFCISPQSNFILFSFQVSAQNSCHVHKLLIEQNLNIIFKEILYYFLLNVGVYQKLG